MFCRVTDVRPLVFRTSVFCFFAPDLSFIMPEELVSAFYFVPRN